MDNLAPLLPDFRFDTQTRFEDGQWTLFSPELNLISGGDDFDEALDELAALAEQYAADVFSRFDFYMQTDRPMDLPWLFRVALTDRQSLRELLTEPPQFSAAA